jgi:uncharacterized protein YoxC
MALKSSYPCSQVENIRELTKTVASLEPIVYSLDHTINGNGQKGLKESVTILNENVKTLSERLEESNKSQKETNNILQGLSNFKISLETTFEEKAKAKVEKEIKKTHLRWLVGISISLFIFAIGLMIDVQKSKVRLREANETIQEDTKIINNENSR